MSIFVGETGIKHLWSKITEKFVQKETGKGLSDNNFSNEYKTEIDNIIGNINVTSLPIKNGNYMFTTSDIESSSNEYALNVVYIDSSRYVYTATNIETGKIFIKTANTIWTKVNNVTTVEN